MAAKTTDAWYRNDRKDDGDAISAIYAVRKGKMTKNELAEHYSSWADNGDYDKHLNRDQYTGPEHCARTISRHFATDRHQVKILDVAAGTGRVGAELFRLGFRNIDALDPSDGMLLKAKELNVYSRFFNEFMDETAPLDISDGAYDGITIAGGIGAGHIGGRAFKEIIRLVRPGGVICVATSKVFIESATEFKDEFLPVFHDLELTRQWKLQSREDFPNYTYGQPGVSFLFVVLEK